MVGVTVVSGACGAPTGARAGGRLGGQARDFVSDAESPRSRPVGSDAPGQAGSLRVTPPAVRCHGELGGHVGAGTGQVEPREAKCRWPLVFAAAGARARGDVAAPARPSPPRGRRVQMRVQEAGWVLAARPGTTGVGGQLPPAAVGAGGQWTPRPSPTFLFYSSFFPSRFVMETLTQPPDGGRARPGLRAFGTLRERGAHSALPGKQLDATKSRVGAGGARRSAPALGSLPPPGSPQAPSPRRGLRVAFGKTQPRNI